MCQEKKIIGWQIRNSEIDGGFFLEPGPESLRIIISDQRQFRGPGMRGRAHCVETVSAQSVFSVRLTILTLWLGLMRKSSRLPGRSFMK